MAFRDYIVLNGFMYKTLAKQWKPSIQRPATARLTLSGELEGTFGLRGTKRWEGIVIATHGEAYPGVANGTLYGNIFSLRGDLQLNSPISFTDHNDITRSAIALGPFEEQTLLNVWNAPANKYYVRVTLVTGF